MFARSLLTTKRDIRFLDRYSCDFWPCFDKL